MPRLSVKQEAFVQAYVTNGGNGTDAYRQAGYKASTDTTARTGAYKMVTSPHIASAIARRQGDIQARNDVSESKLVAATWAIYKAAMAEKQLGAANSAIVTLGKLTGLLDGDRSRATPSIGVVNNYGLGSHSMADLEALDAELSVEQRPALTEGDAP